MELRMTGISITGEWSKEDWIDFYHTLCKFEHRVAKRHGELTEEKDMKASEVIQELTSDDVIIFTPEMETLIQRCCNCRQWHEIKILRQPNGDIHLQYITLDEEPEIDNHQKLRMVGKSS